MAKAYIIVRHDLGQQMQLLSKKLKEHADGRELKANMRKRIRKVAAHTENALRSAVMGVDVQSTRGGTEETTHLRQRIAGAITTEIRATGVRIKVSEKKFANSADSPTAAKRLPKYMAGAELSRWRRWRHPVYPDKRLPRSMWTWTEQEAVTPWWFVTIRKDTANYRRGVGDAIRDTLDNF